MSWLRADTRHWLTVILLTVCGIRMDVAWGDGDQATIADAPADALTLPDWLPHYRLDIDMPEMKGPIRVEQSIRWTNPAQRSTDEILLHVYARHRPDGQQRRTYRRTVESFRINPRISIDEQGRRFHLKQIRTGAQPLEYYWDDQADTVMHVRLPAPLGPGESVEIQMTYEVDIVEAFYRLGYWDGVTNLLNWYPIVAYFGDEGWIAPPFVGWHQPFLNEAGNYDVSIRLPKSRHVVSSGSELERVIEADGRATAKLVGTGIRDFSLVVSHRHEVHEAEACGVAVSVHAFPEHRFYARLALQSAVECIERYTKLLGPYPHPEFKIVESHFGWNGNETTGMVLIDERVFDAPQRGNIYVDHLVSHEVLHQWFYATVGTDGFHETWMDEAVVSHLTEERIHAKYGDKVNLLDIPKPLCWLPNIDYDTFMHSGYPLYHARGGRGKVLAPLTEIGHVHNLFFLAYDRGSRVVGMIHERLGEERFYEFLRIIYAKYQFRVLFVQDFERELEEYTGKDWTAFFNDWLRSPKVTDWKLGKVDIQPTEHGFQTTVRVKQVGEIAEPVNIAIMTEDKTTPERIARLIPEAGTYQAGSTDITRRGDEEWDVTFHSPSRPKQIEIDPDNKVLDLNRVNNRWKMDPTIRLTPIYTPLEEVAMTRPLDRPSFAAGPSIDATGRVGMRGSLMLPNRYRISPFIVYPFTPNDSVFAAGLDGEIMNFPLPNVSLGARYERTIATNLFDLPNDQGEIYLRWNQLYTTSFFYPNLMYTDAYFRFGDNFFPDEDFRRPDNPAAEIYRDVRAFGLRYHFDTRMPYWNPERGFAIDATVENGVRIANVGESYIRGFGQFSVVQKLPDGLGYLSETRIASRIRGGIGGPDNGEHFHFGGPLSFRGQRSEDTEGSAYWLTGADWRFPIFMEIDRNFGDSFLNWRSLYGALLYDVGESYILGRSQGVDHAVGMGLYFNLGLASFVDRVTVRTEYAYSLRYDSNILWFGIYHAY